MLYLQRQKLDTLEDLQRALANAIKLEFATIPPYMTALYSFKPGAANRLAGDIIRSVMIEEMVHLCFACNLLNAVGGRPDLIGSVARYPAALPMGIGDQPGRPFTVPLRRASRQLIQDVFMVIEEPEDPLSFPDQALAAADEQYHTIGDFYRAVQKLIVSLGNIYTGDPSRQVESWVGTNWVHPVYDTKTAVAAIDLIVIQGEGTATSPADSLDEVAHYYRFEQIVRGKTLVRDNANPNKFTWGPPNVPFDDNAIWPMIDNPPTVELPPGSTADRLADDFDAAFTSLVGELHATFDGHPNRLGSAIGLMYGLRLAAQRLIREPIPGSSYTAGPRYRIPPVF